MSAKRGELVMFRATGDSTQVGFVESVVSGDTVNVVAWDSSLPGWQDSVMASRGDGVGEWQPCEMPDHIAGLLDGVVTLGVVNQAIQDALDPGNHIDQAIANAIAAACQTDGVIADAIQAAINP